MVRKIYIYSSEDVKKTSNKCKLASSSTDEVTVISVDTEPKSEGRDR